MKWIINQDRNTIIKFKGVFGFCVELRILDGIYFGCNLYYLTKLMGTFDSIEECFFEIFNIIFSSDIYYSVSGYCDT